MAVLVLEGIVVFGAFHSGAGKSAADFKAFGCGDGEHGFGEVGFEAVKDGLAESDGRIFDSAEDDAAEGIAVGLGDFDQV